MPASRHALNEDGLLRRAEKATGGRIEAAGSTNSKDLPRVRPIRDQGRADPPGFGPHTLMRLGRSLESGCRCPRRAFAVTERSYDELAGD